MAKFIAILLVLAILQTIPSTKASKGRIVGGNEVSIQKHPHQIALRRKACATCTFNHSCGGVVIAEDTIVTAAHCVYNRQINDFIVVAGSDNRNGNDGFVSRLRKITVHEHYNASITDNDIALLYLTTPLPLGLSLVETIELGEQVPRHGAKAVVTGWGTTSEGGVGSAKLLEAEVPIVDNERCNESYGSGRISEAMLCAGVAAGGKDACQGDSGGPLVVAGKLVGIVSWGRGCARPNYPGVYASVPYLRKWILDNIKYENTVFHPDFL